MFRLVYGLVLWVSIASCFAQSKSGGYSHALKVGLSGQFFLQQKHNDATSIYFYPYTNKYTSVGAGVTTSYLFSTFSWNLELGAIIRYPVIKKYLVRRNGVESENERGIVVDFQLEVQHNLHLKNQQLSGSTFGVGATLLNAIGSPSGSYVTISQSGQVINNYPDISMLGPHVFFELAINERFYIKPTAIFIFNDQIDYDPTLSFLVLGQIRLSYLLFGKHRDDEN